MNIEIKSFLPQEEIDICARFRRARMEARLEQSEMAEILGIPRGRLASYEYAKAPVKFSVGLGLCRRLDICQRWLRNGSDPMYGYRESINISNETKANKLPYSAGYDRFLKLKVEGRIEAEKYAEQLHGEDLRVWARRTISAAWKPTGHPIPTVIPNTILAGFFWTHLRQLPPSARLDYLWALIETACAIHAERLAAGTSSPLTNISEVIIQALQMPKPPQSLPDLIDRLKALCDAKGQAAIAREIDVHPSRLNDWVKDRRQPGGEAVFKILQVLKTHTF